MESIFRILLEKYRLQIGIFLVVMILIGGGVLALLSARPNPPEIHKIEEPSSDQVGEATASAAPSVTQQKIKVDVAGAVLNPGVYELSENARIEDALSAAGGLSDEVDQDWVSKNLNLAAKLSDGGKLYIPKVGETTPPSSAGAVSGAGSSDVSSASNPPLAGGGCSRVNINTASAATLAECLSGIGEKRAQNIISYRESHGGFKSIEEIKNVTNIAEGIFSQIKDQITVD